MKKMYYSTDGGVSWKNSSYVPSNPNYTGIAGNTDGTLFCMSNSGKFWSSTDGGENWTARGNTPGDGQGQGQEMVYSSGRFVNLFLYSNVCLTSYSTHGTNWVNSTGYNNSNVSWQNLATDGNGNLIATGYRNNISITAYSSDNGTSWTQGNNIPNGSGQAYPIAYGNGLWVAVARNGPYQTAISSVFPPSWNTTNNTIDFDDITFCSSQNTFYATKAGNGIYKSNNGVLWTQVLSANNAPVTIDYNESQDKFLGVAFNNTNCYTSI